MSRKDTAGMLPPTLLKDLASICVILVLGAMVGTAVNWKMIRGAWEGDYALELAAAEPLGANLQPISIQEVKALADQKKAILVDARLEFFYSKEHIRGAVALPLADYDQRAAEFQKKVGKDRLLITYCSGYGCEDSHQLALKLQQAGYQQVRVFSGGMPEWKQAGFPVEGADVPER